MNNCRSCVVPSEPLARIFRQACSLLSHPDNDGLSLYDALHWAAGVDTTLFDDAALVVTRLMRVPPRPPGGARSLHAALALWRQEHEGQELPVSLAHGFLIQALAAL